MKLLDYGMRQLCYSAIVQIDKLLVRWLNTMVAVNEMQFGFMIARGTIDAVFILRRLQEEYHARGKKLYMYFVDLEKAFDGLPKKV